MAFSSDANGVQGETSRATGLDHAGDGGWTDTQSAPRDLKKLILIIGLGVLSWVATYVGMLELIEANMGELPLVHKLIIGFSVAMLMTMIVWLLDQMFAPIGWFNKLCYAAGYIFLTVISVGFGFGFYWKVLESRSEASRSAESAVGQVQGSLHAASTRLEQLQSTLEQLTQVSKEKAEQERANGNTCPGSKPGDGPRRKLREDDAGRFAFASDFVKGRVSQVKSDMGALDGDLAKITKDDKSTVDAKSGTRNEFMKALGRKLDMTVTGFNAFRTDPQLRQIRTDLAERGEKTSFPDTKGNAYACPDGQLQTALRGVVRAIDQLPELEKPKIAAVEGSEATIEAFRRLTATFYGLLSFKMPPSADELRTLQQKAVQSVEGAAVTQRAAMAEQVGLSKRDYVPLAIALFVDLCLLLVSMGRPVNRLHGLVPRMKEAERGPFYQIVSKFNDIHKDPETRDKFEMFRHVVFDFHGDYYVAVPLDAPYRVRSRGAAGHPEKEYTRAVEELQGEAHLLANLFASFEKERIFSRVYNPLLTTKTIQRKLWRQGSKYAGSQAFRVYRFRDGAWSEIILNVVLGAARRVEAEKRAKRRQDGHTLTMPGAGGGTTTRTAQPQPQPIAPNGGSGHPGRPAEAPRGPRPPELPQNGASNGHGNNGHANNGLGSNGLGSGHDLAGNPTGWAPTHAGNGTMHRNAGPTRTGHQHSGPHAPTMAHDGASEPEAHSAKFGPYASHVPPQASYDRGSGRPVFNGLRPAHMPSSTAQPPSHDYRELAAALDAYNRARATVREADVSVRTAANSNTAPHLRPAAAIDTLDETATQRVATQTAAAHVAESQVAAAASGAATGTYGGYVPVMASAPIHNVAPSAAPAHEPSQSRASAPAMAPASGQIIALPMHPLPQSADAAATPAAAPPVVATLEPHARPDMVDVVISRETATFSIPASEAAIPQSLAGLLRRAAAQDPRALAETAQTLEIAREAATVGTEVIALPAPPPETSVPAVRQAETPSRAETTRRSSEIDIESISQRFAPLPKVIPAE